MGTASSIPEFKWPGRENDHPPQFCVEVKNGGIVAQEIVVAMEPLFKHVSMETNSRDRIDRHERNKGTVYVVFPGGPFRDM
jgi:hypothetical protein